MQKFNYIVIDDELPSHLIVRKYFKFYSNYICIGTFFNPKEALIFLEEYEVDLIFLDIEMPEINGFQFLEALKKNIFVVILTAYPEKYSLHAHHYIDKNLVFFSNKTQFLYYLPKIIARFEKLYEEKKIINRVNQLSKNKVHTFPKRLKNKSILLTDILTVTVIGHNTVLRMKNGKENIFRMTLREIMGFLPESNFLHIRRNVIINIAHITAFTDTTVRIEDQHFHISIRKQEEIVEKLKIQKQELYKDY